MVDRKELIAAAISILITIYVTISGKLVPLEVQELSNTNECLVDCETVFRIRILRDKVGYIPLKKTLQLMPSEGSLPLRDSGINILQNFSYLAKEDSLFCQPYNVTVPGNITNSTMPYNKTMSNCTTTSYSVVSYKDVWQPWNAKKFKWEGYKWYYFKVWGKKTPKLGSNDVHVEVYMFGRKLPLTWWSSHAVARWNFTITGDAGLSDHPMNCSFGVPEMDTYGYAGAVLVDNANNTVSYKIIVPEAGKGPSDNASVIFNDTAGIGPLQFYETDLAAPADLNLSNWGSWGDNYDEGADGAKPSGPNWSDNACAGKTWYYDAAHYYSGTPTGNNSMNVTLGDCALDQNFVGITQGKWQVRFRDIGSTGADAWRLVTYDASWNSGQQFQLDTPMFTYRNSGTKTDLTHINVTAWYLLEVEFDTTADKYNFTLSNSTWMQTVTGVDAYQASGVLTLFRELSFNTGGKVTIDDFWIRDTSGVYDDPTCTIGPKETEVPVDTCTPSTNWAMDCADNCTKTDETITTGAWDIYGSGGYFLCDGCNLTVGSMGNNATACKILFTGAFKYSLG